MRGRSVNNFFETSKKATKKRRLGFLLWTIRAFLNVVLILAISAITLIVGLYVFVIREYGDRLDQRYPELAQDSYVYDANGGRIGEFEVEESRETVGFDDFGEHLPQPP